MTNGKKYFKQWNGKNTLFVIYLGSNDISIINNKKSDLNTNQYVNNNKTVEENINDINDIIYKYVDKLYKNGGKSFMIMNLAPFHLAPVNAENKYKYFETEIPYFNSLLNQNAKLLFEKYSDINIIIYNTNAMYNYIIKNYKNFNFITGREAWTSHKNENKDKYFWSNLSHITKKGNEIISNNINEFLLSLNY